MISFYQFMHSLGIKPVLSFFSLSNAHTFFIIIIIIIITSTNNNYNNLCIYL